MSSENQNNKPKILIIGAYGFLGQHFAKYCLKKDNLVSIGVKSTSKKPLDFSVTPIDTYYTDTSNFIKKNIPPRYIELITNKGIALTKIPKGEAVISDLFVLRMEDGWETFFEYLQFQSLLNTDENELAKYIHIVFYNQKGHSVGDREVKVKKALKTTLNVNQIAKELGIEKDGLFAVFHPYKESWLKSHNTFLAERGYLGYVNKSLGPIKGFVHGNLDAIAKFPSKEKYQLLGNYSFSEKEYSLQHKLIWGNTYKLNWVNPTDKNQKFSIETCGDKSQKIENYNIPPRGTLKYVKTVHKKEKEARIIIKSKLYLARPVVFKIMSASFDVFHG